jgi:Fe2+ transport system protein B
MKILETLNTLTIAIAAEQQNLTALKSQYAIAHQSYTDWSNKANAKCSGFGNKKQACEDTKTNYYRPEAEKALINQNALMAKVNASEAKLRSLLLEQTAQKEAQTAINQQTVTLSEQGLTAESVETAAEAAAQSQLLKTTQEVDAKAAADQKELEQKANRNRLFLIFGIFLFLVIVILIIRKLRKSKKS